MNDIGVRVVVIGGGTGSFTLLKNLKYYTRHLTALVNMADDGGSTGILRDELGVLPAGDVRQCLVALAESAQTRELFNYRFEEGTFAGHAFGNIFMAALEKMTGNFAEAVEEAGRVLNITGIVEPVTLDPVTLVMENKDGSVVRGESQIGGMDFGTTRRPRIRLDPEPIVNPRALAAIESADLVVIAPGNVYGSLAAALVTPGIDTALKKSHAKKVYVCNLVTKPGQTDGFTVADFAHEIERFMGTSLDYVLYSTSRPSADLIRRYAHDGEQLVVADQAELAQAQYTAKAGDFLSNEFTAHNSGVADPLIHARSYIRHDGDKIARALMKIYFS